MAENFKMMYISGQQQIADEIEENIRNYLRDLNDDYLHDNLKDAWKDPHIGGKREEVETRIAVNNSLSRNAFADFRRNRIEEIEATLKNSLNQKEQKSLNQEKTALKEAKSWIDFARKQNFEHGYALPQKRWVGGDPYEVYESAEAAEKRMDWSKFYDPAEWVKSFYDNNQNLKDNSPQINWLVAKTPALLDSRFNMMQSVCYQMAARERLPSAEAETANQLLKKVSAGFEHWHQQKDVPWYKVWQPADKNLPHKDIEKYMYQADGLTAFYKDALAAIYQTPQWKEVCAYQAKMAEERRDNISKVSWKDPSDIAGLAAMKGYNAPLETNTLWKNLRKDEEEPEDREESYFYRVESSLKQLKKMEQLYQFVTDRVNEYSVFAKQYPKEAEEIKKSVADIKNTLFDLNINDRVRRYDDILFNSMKSMTDRLWEKDSLIDGSLNCAGFAIGGAAMAVAGALTEGMAVPLVAGLVAGAGAEVGKSYYGENWKDFLKKYDWYNGFAEWANDVKNATAVDHCQQIFQQSMVEKASAADRTKKAVESENFIKALDYAASNASDQDKALYQFVKEAMKMKSWTPEEISAFEKKAREASEKIEDDGTAERNLYLVNAVRTGLYWNNAIKATGQLIALNDDGKDYEKMQVACYKKDAAALQGLAASLGERNQAMLEAELSENLLDKYQAVLQEQNGLEKGQQEDNMPRENEKTSNAEKETTIRDTISEGSGFDYLFSNEEEETSEQPFGSYNDEQTLEEHRQWLRSIEM